VRRILWIMLPILPTQLLLYGRTLAERQFGSWLPAGDLAYLNYSYRIGTAPMMFIANAIIVAYLPVISRKAAAGDQDGLRSSIVRGIRLMLLGTLPFAVVFVALPGETIGLLLEHGAFTATDTAATAGLLRWYTIALVAGSLSLLLSQAYFAQGKGGKALAAAAIGVATQFAVSAWWLPSHGATAVAVGTSVGFVATALVLSCLLTPFMLAGVDDRGRALMRGALLLLPPVSMLLVIEVTHRILATSWVPSMPAVLGYIITLAAGAAVYTLAVWRLGVPELGLLLERLRSKFKSAPS
jgi:putative peptidoglycan lipid II flippase